MNRIFKKIWNKARGCYVAVSECTGIGQSLGCASVATLGAVLIMAASPTDALADNRSWSGTAEGETRNLGYDRWILERQTNVCEKNSVTNVFGWIDLTGWDRVENHGTINLKGANRDHWGNSTNDMSLYIGSNVDWVTNYGTINVEKVSGIFQASGAFYNKSGGVTELYGSHHSRYEEAKFINEGTYNIHSSGSIVANSKIENSGTMDNSGDVTANKGLDSTGRFLNSGSLSVSGASDISSVTGSGSTTLQSGTIRVSSLSQSSLKVGSSANVSASNVNTSSITNAGTLNVTTLDKYSGISYTQTGGSITVANNWFDKSTLNIRGGSLSRAQLGVNTVNLSAGTLTGSLSQGTSLNQTGGTYNGTFDEFFVLTSAAPDGLNVISLNAGAPEEVRTALTDLFTKYVPGHVAESLADRATFNGGKVVLSGVTLTTTQRDDLVNAFKEKFSVFPRVFRS